MAEHLEHRLRPISAGFAVPLFAFLAAGVTIGGWSGFTNALPDRVTLGVIVGLVFGKALGIFGTTYLLSRFTRVELATDLSWPDVRSEEHTSELQSLMRNSYAVTCLIKKKTPHSHKYHRLHNQTQTTVIIPDI